MVIVVCFLVHPSSFAVVVGCSGVLLGAIHLSRLLLLLVAMVATVVVVFFSLPPTSPHLTSPLSLSLSLSLAPTVGGGGGGSGGAGFLPLVQTACVPFPRLESMILTRSQR